MQPSNMKPNIDGFQSNLPNSGNHSVIEKKERGNPKNRNILTVLLVILLGAVLISGSPCI
jgi:hypothetical protein